MRAFILGRSRRRIVKDFVAAKATTAERGIVYVAEEVRMFRRLCSYGAIVKDGAGHYHLDARKLDAFRGAVRRRVTVIAASGVVASAAAAVFSLAE